MRRLREIWARPIPAEQSLLVFATAAVILLVVAAVLVALPGPSIETPNSGPVTIETDAIQTDPPRRLDSTAEAKTSARRFMTGYLRLASGHVEAGRIEAASPGLTRRLESPVRVPPAARQRHPRLVELDAGPVSAGHVSVTATVEAAGITYPVILDLEATNGRWLVTRVGAE